MAKLFLKNKEIFLNFSISLFFCSILAATFSFCNNRRLATRPPPKKNTNQRVSASWC